MKIKIVLSVLVLAILTGCKNETKSDSDVVNKKQDIPKTETITNVPKTFDGTWRNKSDTQESEVILETKDNEVSGTLMYQEFDENGELTSSTGLLSIIGNTENGILKADLYDPKGRKASTANISLDKKELKFTLTGQKINYPDSFSAKKVD